MSRFVLTVPAEVTLVTDCKLLMTTFKRIIFGAKVMFKLLLNSTGLHAVTTGNNYIFLIHCFDFETYYVISEC